MTNSSWFSTTTRPEQNARNYSCTEDLVLCLLTWLCLINICAPYISNCFSPMNLSGPSGSCHELATAPRKGFCSTRVEKIICSADLYGCKYALFAGAFIKCSYSFIEYFSMLSALFATFNCNKTTGIATNKTPDLA